MGQAGPCRSVLRANPEGTGEPWKVRVGVLLLTPGGRWREGAMGGAEMEEEVPRAGG